MLKYIGLFFLAWLAVIWWLAISPVQAAVTFTQVASGGNAASVTTVNLAVSNAVTTGNPIFIAVSFHGNVSAVSIVDPASNTYTQLLGSGVSAPNAFFFECLNPTGFAASGNITVNWTSASAVGGVAVTMAGGGTVTKDSNAGTVSRGTFTTGGVTVANTGFVLNTQPATLLGLGFTDTVLSTTLWVEDSGNGWTTAGVTGNLGSNEPKALISFKNVSATTAVNYGPTAPPDATHTYALDEFGFDTGSSTVFPGMPLTGVQ